MHDRPARFVENHDGDTITVLLDQDFDDMKKINIRLANVWAPEMNEDGGKQVKAMVAFICAAYKVGPGFPLVVHTHKTKTGKNIKSFDRYVATVMMPDGESLNSKLMKYIAEIGVTGGVGRAGLLREGG